MSHAVAQYGANVEASMEYLLAAARSQGQSEETVASLLRETADLLTKRQPRGGALSDEQIRYLIDSGALTAEEFADAEARVARGELAEAERLTRLGAISQSLSAAEVALRLCIDSSRVRHRQAKGGLYSFLAGGMRRYPTWQFVAGGGDGVTPVQVLPGMASLVKAFSGELHPASIHAFMTTPQESLQTGGPAGSAHKSGGLTPVEWLQSGGDVQALVGILYGFLQS